MKKMFIAALTALLSIPATKTDPQQEHRTLTRYHGTALNHDVLHETPTRAFFAEAAAAEAWEKSPPSSLSVYVFSQSDLIVLRSHAVRLT